jgi:hypothetical protein
MVCGNVLAMSAIEELLDGLCEPGRPHDPLGA